MSNQTMPIFIRREANNISSIHFPMDEEYEDIVAIVEKVAKEFYMTFEQAAETLGYELGAAHKQFV